MGDLFPVALSDLQAEVRRELQMRAQVYPRLVGSGKLTQDRADQYIERLSRVSHILALLGEPQVLQEFLQRSDFKVFENRVNPGAVGVAVDWSKFVAQLMGEKVG